jgi:hypothetical protein
MKEMKSSFFVILCFFGGTLLQAQSASRVDLLEQWQDAGERNQVRIEVDSLLVDNYYKLMVLSSKVSGVPGYRIRIYSESGAGAKEEQQRERARFLSLFPDVDAYYRYDEPYFKVYVGDCRTRSEALKLYDRIKKSFPNPILVEDYINIQ